MYQPISDFLSFFLSIFLSQLHSGELELLSLLLKHGLDPESTNNRGWSAFLVAAANGDLEGIDVLGPHANVNRINPVDGECALSLASKVSSSKSQ